MAPTEPTKPDHDKRQQLRRAKIFAGHRWWGTDEEIAAHRQPWQAIVDQLEAEGIEPAEGPPEPEVQAPTVHLDRETRELKLSYTNHHTLEDLHAAAVAGGMSEREARAVVRDVRRLERRDSMPVIQVPQPVARPPRQAVATRTSAQHGRTPRAAGTRTRGSRRGTASSSSSSSDPSDPDPPGGRQRNALEAFKELFGGPPSPALLGRLARKSPEQTAEFWQDVERVASSYRGVRS